MLSVCNVILLSSDRIQMMGMTTRQSFNIPMAPPCVLFKLNCNITRYNITFYVHTNGLQPKETLAEIKLRNGFR